MVKMAENTVVKYNKSPPKRRAFRVFLYRQNHNLLKRQ
ncbi:MAG: hypothetical protein JG780_1188 [Thermosipho sp. (in: Bacteria)]|jgi:hypothetical protein|nr:hypothetical protein [Thermosipho sp. (in: thermotogales)]